MHINNQKLSLDIFMVGILQNIFMEHDLYILMNFCITFFYNFDSYKILLVMTAFVLQAHIYYFLLI